MIKSKIKKMENRNHINVIDEQSDPPAHTGQDPHGNFHEQRPVIPGR